MHGPSHQRGNILFLILLAVVLFAALSYAVTGNQREQVNSLGERAKTYAGEIINHAASVEAAVSRMTLIEGCLASQIDFAYSNNTNPMGWNYGNGSAPPDGHCGIFNQSKGGKVARVDKINLDWLDSARSGNTYYGYWVSPRLRAFKRVGIDTDGDIAYILPYLKKELCEEINRQLGIPMMVNSAGVIDDRSFPDTNGLNVWATVDPVLANGDKFNGRAFCTYTTNSFGNQSIKFYAFIQIVMGR